jgi:hypothetical protein
MRRINMYITLVLVLLLLVYLALLDTLAKPLFEHQATEMYGAEVSIDSLTISPFLGKVTLYNLQVADRRDSMRNLAQADRAYIDIDMFKLAQDIIEIDGLEVDGLVMMGRRREAATILRPLVAEDSAIAQAGLPTFELPDADALIASQREKLGEDIAQFKFSMMQNQTKWEKRIATLPSQADIDEYRVRISQLKQSGSLADKLATLNGARKIYADIDRDVQSLKLSQREFRADLESMREKIKIASTLPQKHADQLIASLGLSGDQLAQIGSQVLRGDLSGLTQQVLAPLAYNASEAAGTGGHMPIFIATATINGSILPSAAGLSASGRLESFAWPLHLAAQPTVFKLEGNSLDGGSLRIDAVLDHRAKARDRITVLLENLPLRKMELAGTDQLSVELEQTLANVSGQLLVEDDVLSGKFTQHLSNTLFNTELAENAGDAARMLAAVLDASTEFVMEIAFSGTLESPQIHFNADLDQLIETTLRNAISEQVNALTFDLQNRISSEIGPEIASAREQFASLERLQKELEASLKELPRTRP